jgi:hypothetical protein
MSKRSVFGKLLTSDTLNSYEHFTPFSKSSPLTVAVFAPQPVIMMQMRKYYKSNSDRIINMIFVAGDVNGVLKVYHNESSCSTPSTSPTR